MVFALIVEVSTRTEISCFEDISSHRIANPDSLSLLMRSLDCIGCRGKLGFRAMPPVLKGAITDTKRGG